MGPCRCRLTLGVFILLVVNLHPRQGPISWRFGEMLVKSPEGNSGSATAFQTITSATVLTNRKQ